MNKKYSEVEIQLIKDNADKSIRELAQLTQLTEKSVIYIKQKYKIYKKWQEHSTP